MNGCLVVISAPSGAGKTTICRELQKERPDWIFSVSCTTRPKREYEKDGYDYEFISQKKFDQMVKAGGLVEYEEVHGYMYGTKRDSVEKAIENGDVLLLEVDVKGGVAIKEAYPEKAISFFIRPPSKEELKRRLRKRGVDSEARITKRLERMEMEMAFEDQYDSSVVNDDVSETINTILGKLSNWKNGGTKNGN
ncbi:MAG: guanylate kinase [Candidatus Marinimicrobia bacterium]|jgi:guanylate kinase|nr:guanylate kinase [Candidatus Neomarinimicrobiota bacterium]MDP6456113.1 guanylate kinase [Candidatus Neomarinimicrobiota bacterium]MDP6592897.1 guanylate kinase [Candidatus Neomarinimicrobiota bacterium]MDP6836170.1 guanylate kinase [Candidatus Neomarinimicrobiota bacterium]MDP6966885.1 guanylate kinase [Candidatus Neomarinimicrobiota bacterium]|tara:strand:- start:16396 stop:16977 length:582 start_codon:yes stop_codon:yes gene_type:complete